MHEQDTQRSHTEEGRGIDLSSAPDDVRATLNRIMFLEDQCDRFRAALEDIARLEHVAAADSAVNAAGRVAREALSGDAE